MHRGAPLDSCNMILVDLIFERIKYLIFSFPRSGNEAKRGVEHYHSTRNDSRIRQKVENVSVLMGTECFSTRLPG